MASFSTTNVTVTGYLSSLQAQDLNLQFLEQRRRKIAKAERISTPNQYRTLRPIRNGILRWTPEQFVPYAELMRIHKPAGYYAFAVPFGIGLLFAAAITKETVSVPVLISALIIHAIGNIFLRGAGCSWNDTIDAPFDRLVARCKDRPVARGAVTTTSAHAFTFLMTAIWFAILGKFSPAVYLPAITFIVLLGVYPFCKRFTNFPQIILGFALGLGQTTAMASLGLDMLTETSSLVKTSAACLYLSNVVNAMIYDTVYAHQDLKDDLKAGVMSMAVACRGQTKVVLSCLSVLEVVLLILSGHFAQFGVWYFITACGGVAIALGYMIHTVDLERPADCMKWFTQILQLSGAAICTGLAGEYVSQLLVSV